MLFQTQFLKPSRGCCVIYGEILFFKNFSGRSNCLLCWCKKSDLLIIVFYSAIKWKKTKRIIYNVLKPINVYCTLFSLYCFSCCCWCWCCCCFFYVLQPLLVFLFCCSFPTSILFKMFFYLSDKIIHKNVEVIKESYSDPKKHFHGNITVDWGKLYILTFHSLFSFRILSVKKNNTNTLWIWIFPLLLAVYC